MTVVSETSGTHLNTTPPGSLDPADHHRQFESPTAGLSYVIQGPDPFALTMPPAPKAGSNELVAEMGEVYQMALHRDFPVASFMDAGLVAQLANVAITAAHNDAETAAGNLSQMDWFQGNAAATDTSDPEQQEYRRFGQVQTAANIYRGVGEDAWPTPFLSQFMLIGTGPDVADRESGMVRFGNQRIDQKINIAPAGKDYMTMWDDWLDVQNAYNARKSFDITDGTELSGNYRHITTVRDMATYVHDDALYQAYLNAALILWNEGNPVDPGLPFHGSAVQVPATEQDPFAVFGGPHLLTLVTEAATRALRAVRLQKFSVHRRLRPEALAARFHTVLRGYDPGGHGAYSDDPAVSEVEATAREALSQTIAPYIFPKPDPKVGIYKILEDIRLQNADQNGDDGLGPNASWLLPMAFPEGSPMHPSYGAGHATVAGACVTMLKAFFAMEQQDGTKQWLVQPGDPAFVPVPGADPDGSSTLEQVIIPEGLTIEGELNKVAWNISNARNMAGVYYCKDYIKSLILGENIALGILREQMFTYDPLERVSMTVPLFTPRRLPDNLSVGYIAPDAVVSKVKVRSDGYLEAVPDSAPEPPQGIQRLISGRERRREVEET